MNIELEKKSIERLKSFEPDDGQGYFGCYSGGKDSDVIKILLALSGCKHEMVHSLTTVDAPETVQYIKSQKDVRIEKPKLSMWQLIVKKGMPPTRLVRYCCAELKETAGKGRIKVTGVRWDESASRAESSDIVKIIGKPVTVQKKAEELNANFRSTNGGGWC